MSSWSAPAAVPGWLLVVLCAVSGAYCLGRARRAGRRARGAAAGEALMGLGTAVMAAPPGIGPWGPQVLLAVFCGAALHALWLLRDGLHHAHHLVGSLAMAYMALTMASDHGAGTEAGAGVGVGAWAGRPLVTAALLVYFAGYVLLGGARLVAAPQAGGAGGAAGGAAAAGADALAAGSAELARACRLAMGIGMLAMLLGM
ncbi:DUF5134 domain-containing protein [Streptomyces sp. NPDC090445]|uniref:DUF5134 domain-containing protein n=1 Tax=Streptomyces sp. NPDC090445 TaxID=3365963 RepID=UPI0037F382C5